MAGNSSRSKGSAFERLIREHFASLQQADPRRWQVTHRSRSRQPGADLVVWHANTLELVIECKNHQSVKLAEWWQQTVDQAGERGGGAPLLIHKRRGHTAAEDQWVTMSLGSLQQLLEDLA